VTATLSDFRALTFDCYGTLIDWESGIWDALQPLFLANDVVTVDRRAALAAFGRCEHKQQLDTPDMRYTALLAQVHRAVASELALDTTPELDDAFGLSVPTWPAFQDSADALRYLKTRYRLVILSNVDHPGIAASLRKLGVDFDAVYTAEDIGSYKPADANFEYLIGHVETDLGIAKAGILHTAQSLLHDHRPANRFGLANAWIDRQRLSIGGEKGAVDAPAERPHVRFKFFSMAEMAEAVRAAVD